MGRSRLGAGAVVLPLLALLIGCGGGDAPVKAPPSPPIAPVAQPASLPGAPPAGLPAPVALVPPAPAALPDPCGALGRVVDAEPEGFLGLRGEPAGDRRWGGVAVPEGFADCWIEDLPAGGPHYVCRAERFAEAPEALAADHLALLTAFEACLAQPTWFPLAWRREPAAAGPGAGRRAVWRAEEGVAGPVVALALEPHPERALWWNRLVVGPSAGGLAGGS